MNKCKYYGGTASNPLDDNGSYILCSLMQGGKTFYPFTDNEGKEQNHKCWNAGVDCPFLQRKENEDMDENQMTLAECYPPVPVNEAANTEVSTKHIEACNLHRKILTDTQIAADSLVALAEDLKQMRDSKLYTELGYTTFEDYSEKAAGIKQRQAYNFIKALDSFGTNGLQANASLGITKLAALATLAENDREVLMQSEDVEALSTRELQAKIDELQHKFDQQTLDFTALAAEKSELSEQLENENSLKESLNEALKKIKELESRPIDVAVQEPSEEEKQSLRDKIAAEITAEKEKEIKSAEEKAKKAAEEEAAKIKSLQARLDDTGNAMRKAAQEKKVAEEKAAALEKQITELQATAKKSVAPPPSEKKAVLKYHFEAIQKAFNASVEIISALEGEEKAKYKSAMLKLTDACKTSAEGIECV